MSTQALKHGSLARYAYNTQSTHCLQCASFLLCPPLAAAPAQPPHSLPGPALFPEWDGAGHWKGTKTVHPYIHSHNPQLPSSPAVQRSAYQCPTYRIYSTHHIHTPHITSRPIPHPAQPHPTRRWLAAACAPPPCSPAHAPRLITYLPSPRAVSPWNDRHLPANGHRFTTPVGDTAPANTAATCSSL